MEVIATLFQVCRKLERLKSSKDKQHLRKIEEHDKGSQMIQTSLNIHFLNKSHESRLLHCLVK